MSHALQIQESRSTSLFPGEQEWALLKEQASMIVRTGFLPAAIKTPEQAIAIALKGRELGIPMMQAFAHVHIIQGKPTISAELMLSLIFRNCQGAIVNYVQTSNETCVIEAKRPNGSAARFSFTIEEARKAGLLNKDSWRNYPGAMLRARAVSIMARALFPDAIMGCSYIPEEMGADVNEEGEVISIPVEPPSPATTLIDTTSHVAGPIAPAVQPKPGVVIAPKSQDFAPARLSRGDLGVAIMKAADAINLTNQGMAEWIEDLYKKPMAKLTTTEMEDFYNVLECERAGVPS